jgi:hypothetical protein
MDQVDNERENNVFVVQKEVQSLRGTRAFIFISITVLRL